MKKPNSLPDIKLLNEYFFLDVVSGIITRKISSGPSRVGDIVGNKNSSGYLKTKFQGQYLKVSRLAWAIYNNKDPYPHEIDHINGIRDDNRPDNLRLSDRSLNTANRHVCKSSTGVVGIGIHKNKYRARFTRYGKTVEVGEFLSLDEAKTALYLAKSRSWI